MINNKIQGLNFLKKHAPNIGHKVPDYTLIQKRRYKLKKDLELKKIKKKFKKLIIIRSSAKDEDNFKKTNAGKYLSKVSDTRSLTILKNNIELVLAKLKDDDYIIIQNYIKEVDIAGVIFSRDHNNGGPYYIINYDNSGKTNLITSGHKNPLIKTSIIHHSLNHKPKKFNLLIKYIKKIIAKLKNDKLDIEFAIKNNKVYLFQIRHLNIKTKNLDKEISTALFNFNKKLKKIFSSSKIVRTSTILSNMTDWNPAEMIGKKPSNLSMSIYKKIITDDIWAKQRSYYGYLDVRPNRLMFNLLGSPYINVKTDFESFIPKKINKKDKNKIVSKYLNELKKDISNHDKVEFNVIETCFSLNTQKKLNKIKIKNLSYINELKKLTENILTNKNQFLNFELNKISKIKKEIRNLNKRNLSPVEKIYYSIYKCREIGTLSFSGIARIAFIYTKILRDLKDNNFISTNFFDRFFSSLDLISDDILRLAYQTKKNKKLKKKFDTLYGHIRPSTYSIEVKNYKQNFKNYFKSVNYKNRKKSIKLSDEETKTLNKSLKVISKKLSSKIFLKDAKKSIEAREYSKNEFTKFIDFIFENINKLAREMGIDERRMKFINIETLLSQYENLSISKLKKILLKEIKINKKDYEILSQTKLPDVIKSDKDIYYYELKRNIPSYITNLIITGQIIQLKKNMNFDLLKNNIVAIENADPGYDFIFSYNIKGLITKYGGSNSHMAIRCQENNIPAIIGSGEIDFENIIQKKTIQIDCKNNNYKTIF
ncbi:PEP-utilizing enzyme [Candidatus Pelagibacter sp.]|nr:PEP-utilizing enzyme [Candidatus Pelagibacter sp.]